LGAAGRAASLKAGSPDEDRPKATMPARLRVLRAVGAIIACIAAATQLTYIASAWWSFDPRVSCDRLPGWGEWLECLHGNSHAYVTTTEAAVVSWAIAIGALLLGRILAPYFSMLLPAAIVALFSLYLADLWRQSFVAYAPFGETTLKDALAFAETALPITLFFVGPIFGAWFLGIYRRYRPRRIDAEVFD